LNAISPSAPEPESHIFISTVAKLVCRWGQEGLENIKIFPERFKMKAHKPPTTALGAVDRVLDARCYVTVLSSINY